MENIERQERRFKAVVAVGIALVVASFVALGFVLPSGEARVNYTAVLGIAVGSFTGYSCFRTARMHPAARRRVWRLVGGTAWVWAAAQSVQLVGPILGIPSVPVIVDIMAIAVPLLSLAATLSVATERPSVRVQVRLVLDGIIVAAVIFLLGWVFYLQPHLPIADLGDSQVWTSTARLVCDVLIVVTALSLLVSRSIENELPHGVFGLLIGGISLFMLSDLFASIGIFSGWYERGFVTDAFVIAGFALGSMAANHPKQFIADIKQLAYPGWFEIVPTFIAGSALVCMFPALIRSNAFNEFTVALAGLLFGAVLFRQLFAVLEEQRLSSLLHDLMDRRSKQFDERERHFQALVQNSSDVTVVVDDSLKITYVSPSVRHVFGLDVDEVENANIDSLVAEKDRARVRALFAMAGRRVGVSMTAEWTAERSDGELRQLEVLIRNSSAEEPIDGTMLNLRDVTERKELQDKLTHQALHDHLTGLPNRAQLQASIDKALARWLFQGEVFSLLVIDLDDFKYINDSYGHLAGDIVLQTLAERFQSVTRRGDFLVRLSGNEFALLLPGVAADDLETTLIADRVIETVQQEMDVEGRKLSIGASIGVACVSDDVSQPEDLLRNADLALHAAKVSKRGGWVQFEASMHESAIRRSEMVTDLRHALENDELQLYYQPTVDLATGHFEGVEALLRWPHPERGFVSPVDFIPVAEEAGLIVPIGEWVLEHACAQMAKWQARYPSKQPLLLNVNLSGRQLAEPNIVETIERIYKNSGLIPGTLVLEMTESVLMDDHPSVLAKMEGLRALGCDLSIDDFGTGYSSLSYLRQFPINVLKVDRAFVMNLGTDKAGDDTALVQAIVDLAGTLRMRTVAEGIETPAQLAIVRSMGCDVGQGYFLGKPAPAEDIRRMIEATVGEGKPVPGAALPNAVVVD